MSHGGLSSSITSLNLSEVDADRLFFHKSIIKGKLEFAIFTDIPLRNPQLSYWTLDDREIYSSFSKDFGPPNAAQLYRFCLYVKYSIEKAASEGKAFVFYSYEAGDLTKRTNAVFLIGAYAIMVEKISYTKVETWFAPLFSMNHILPYLDVSIIPHSFTISLSDCWRGLHKSRKTELFTLDSFDLRLYEHFDMIQNGDMNWIVPNKLLAFSSPVDHAFVTSGSDAPIGKSKQCTHQPQFFVDTFQKFGVSTIVRTSKPEYDRMDFVKAGYDHYDLYFVDGSVPSREIVDNFLEIVDNSDGVVAVHCKAGLGRTGTLIACYLIKTYGFTAREAIAYCRIRRPGSVIGEQQEFLAKIQDSLLALNGIIPKKKRAPPDHSRDDYHDESFANLPSSVSHAPHELPKRRKLDQSLYDELTPPPSPNYVNTNA